jgi:hypothetical protein
VELVVQLSRVPTGTDFGRPPLSVEVSLALFETRVRFSRRRHS